MGSAISESWNEEKDFTTGWTLERCFRHALPFLRAVINRTSNKRIAQSALVSCSTFAKKAIYRQKGGALTPASGPPACSRVLGPKQILGSTALMLSLPCRKLFRTPPTLSTAHGLPRASGPCLSLSFYPSFPTSV